MGKNIHVMGEGRSKRACAYDGGKGGSNFAILVCTY